LEKDVLHDNNLQHPDMGINIAGLLLEQKKRIKEEKFLIINTIYTLLLQLDFMQYRLITA
jgi:hypothetical protein